MAAGLSAEQLGLIACARHALGLQSGPVGSVNWSRFLSLAGRYGLVPIAQAGLAGPAAAAPDGARQFLSLGQARLQQRLEGQVEPLLRRASQTLQAAGLRPIVLKGPALAYTAYPHPALRTFTDVDLLVAAQDVPAASDALRAEGFIQEERGPLPSDDYHLPPFRAAEGGLEMELHHHILCAAGPFRLDLDAMRARASSATVAGIEALVLSPLDNLLHLAVHLSFGHAYRWYPLRTLVDILALTQHAARRLDWDELVSLAHASRLTGALFWPLLLSRRWLGAEIPEPALRALAPPRPIRRSIERVMQPSYILDDLAPETGGSAVLHDVLLRFSLYSGCSPARQVGALIENLFPSTDAVTHLPPEVKRSPLRYAAALLNPARLARGLGALGRLIADRRLARG